MNIQSKLSTAVMAIVSTLFFSEASYAVSGFSVSNPDTNGISRAALASLRTQAIATHTSSLVIVKNGHLVADWEWDKRPGPIEAMSATKSIVDLAIGRLIDTGRIKSIDEPVYTWYPEWNQGRKKQITLRMLLNHTSGLQADRTTEEIYASPDFIQLALCADLSSDPGTQFFYNNKAVNLIAGIVQKASGEKMDHLIGKEIFAPLGITDYSWDTDKAGNPQGMAGLQISAVDFAKIGQMMLNGGTWNGKRIISQSWINQSVAAGQPYDDTCGLLWWRLPSKLTYSFDQTLLSDWRKHGVPDDIIARAGKYVGQSLDSTTINACVADIFGSMSNAVAAANKYGLTRLVIKTTSGNIGYYADGYLGQFVVVIPSENLVTVRMIDSSNYKSEADGFPSFPNMVPGLVASGTRTAK